MLIIIVFILVAFLYVVYDDNDNDDSGLFMRDSRNNKIYKFE